MAVLMAQQDDQITAVETKAIGVEDDTRKGLGGQVPL